MRGLLLLTEDAPSEEWDAAEGLVQERGEGEDSYGQDDVHVGRWHCGFRLQECAY